jgi:hypothetical protein
MSFAIFAVQVGYRCKPRRSDWIVASSAAPFRALLSAWQVAPGSIACIVLQLHLGPSSGTGSPAVGFTPYGVGWQRAGAGLGAVQLPPRCLGALLPIAISPSARRAAQVRREGEDEGGEVARRGSRPQFSGAPPGSPRAPACDDRSPHHFCRFEVHVGSR